MSDNQPPVKRTVWEKQRDEKQQLREQRRALGICMNTPANATPENGLMHGPIVQGGRCQHCFDIKKGRK